MRRGPFGCPRARGYGGQVRLFPKLFGRMTRCSVRTGARAPRVARGLRAFAATALLAFAAMVASLSDARAACDQTTDSTTGATINFTSVGQTYHLCF